MVKIPCLKGLYIFIFLFSFVAYLLTLYNLKQILEIKLKFVDEIDTKHKHDKIKGQYIYILRLLGSE